ncbi:MAG TPA: hypothetical protein H9830_11370 [Candidatus Agrococcus pullicola]|uniref:Lipoprotein n=1 Tax=Candidatus Agrococcus pullicola TaxID=2838429 RepID=A0A9D1YW15_9MICO|nr:hypothetical protein [Candidatus Agrococcus pullicola]
MVATALCCATALSGCVFLTPSLEALELPSESATPSEELILTPQEPTGEPLPLSTDSGFSEDTRIAILDLPEGWADLERQESGRQLSNHEELARTTTYCSLTSEVIQFGHQTSLTTDDILTEYYVDERFAPAESDHRELLRDESLWLVDESSRAVEVRLLQFTTEYLEVPGEGFALHLLRGYAPRSDRSQWFMLLTLECRSPLGHSTLTQNDFNELADELLPGLMIEQAD